MKLYDRLRDEIVDVEPSTPGVLRVYSCGPTVYGRIHIGNARPYWTAMVLKRACEQLLDALRGADTPGRVDEVVERWGAARGGLRGFTEA